MNRSTLLMTVILTLFAVVSDAQYPGYGPPPYGPPVYGRPRVYRRPPPPPPPNFRRQPVQRMPAFKPSLNLTVGYGFPNLDQNHLAEFFDAYKGSVTQQGPVTASLDYQFSRSTSIGVAGTYGKTSAAYFDHNSYSDIPDFNGYLENWSVLFNMVNYFPASSRYVEPYIKTAIGMNKWKQDYLYPNGDKAAVLDDPTSLAYQVSIGSKFNFSPHAGFYLEAGYGKYILNGGLAFKF